MQKILIPGALILVCLNLLLPAFVINNYVKAETATIVINEVAWMGTTVSANSEWLELRNLTDNTISLDGWKLVAADGVPSMNLTGSISAEGYYLSERTTDDTVPNIAADLIYVGALSNSGEILELKDAAGNTVDRLDASAGWPAGDNTTKQTMARNDDGSWQNSSAPGGTPKTVNSVALPPAPNVETAVCGNGSVESGDPSTGSGQEQCDDGNTGSGDGCSSNCQHETVNASSTPAQSNNNSSSVGSQSAKYRLADILINEFSPDPGDNEVEWVELYNARGVEIDLSGWTIAEGSGAKTALSGKIGSSGSSRYFIIEKPKGNLNNSGDIIILRDSGGQLIDQVAYGNWEDGDQSDNAPTAGDPNSVARRINGANTFNNANDFAVTTSPTKGQANIITGTETEEASAEEKAQYDYSDDIYISEILPNPVGADNLGEFIEVFNRGTREVDLAGWRIENSRGQKFVFKTGNETILPPNAFRAVYRSENKITLNNSSDKITLFTPLSEKAKQTVKYKEVAEGQSYNLATGATSTDYNTWAWSETPTPGLTNIIKSVNEAPVVDFTFLENTPAGQPIVFDSSDSYDPKGDKLFFLWEFGDGAKNILAVPEHMYLRPGAYTVKLSVSDGTATTSKEKIIKVTDSTGVIVAAASCAGSECATDVVLSEVMPNPTGTDEEGEWVEVFNRGDARVNLLNWSILSGKGARYKYVIADPTWLDLGQYLVLYRPDTSLVLNNTLDTVRLYDDSGHTVDQTTYENAKEGTAWAREKNNWYWTIKPTPGAANIISTAAVSKTKSASAGSKTSGVKSTSLVETTLDKIKDFEAGDQVRVKGTVAVLPGIYGTQYFYIVGSPGLQVYSYKKDFPDLKIGDYIEVSGELSLINGEPRLKTKTAVDMKVLEHRAPPQPEVLGCDDVNEDMVGRLVSVNGELTECKSTQLIVDDGRDEAAVYLKKNAGVSGSRFEVGQKVTVTGIVGKTSSGAKIMPRSIEDIAYATSSGQVLGDAAVSGEWQLEQKDKRLELYKYLLVVLAAIVVVLAVLVVKYRKDKK